MEFLLALAFFLLSLRFVGWIGLPLPITWMLGLAVFLTLIVYPALVGLVSGLVAAFAASPLLVLVLLLVAAGGGYLVAQGHLPGRGPRPPFW